MINRELVYVEWLDHVSFTTSTWRSEDEFDDLSPIRCETVGWIIKETDDFIIVIGTRNEPTNKDIDTEHEENYLGDILILKSAITKRERIKK